MKSTAIRLNRIAIDGAVQRDQYNLLLSLPPTHIPISFFPSLCLLLALPLATAVRVSSAFIFIMAMQEGLRGGWVA